MKVQDQHQIKPNTQSCQTSVSGSCFQVNYMNKKIHKYTLIKWTDEYVKFKWKQENDGKWHIATQYHDNLNCKWFKTEKEASDFIKNGYSDYFHNYC